MCSKFYHVIFQRPFSYKFSSTINTSANFCHICSFKPTISFSFPFFQYRRLFYQYVPLFFPSNYLSTIDKQQQFLIHCHLSYNEWLCHLPEKLQHIDYIHILFISPHYPSQFIIFHVEIHHINYLSAIWSFFFFREFFDQCIFCIG